MIQKALNNGIKRNTYRSRLRYGWDPERAATERVHAYKGDFAVYKNDEIVVMGTAQECAKELGVTEDYIHWMTTPSAQKRIAERNTKRVTTAVKLDLDDDE